MPYKTKRGTWQYARRLGHVPIVENEFVRRRLESYQVYHHETAEDVAGSLLVSSANLDTPGPKPKWILSFDGSSQEIAVREKYPSTRIGYVQVAGVLVFLERMLSQTNQLFVDPAVIRSAAQESLLSIVLPSSNVSRRDASTVRDSWRAEVFDIFREYNVEGQSLLDVLFRLLQFGDRAPIAGNAVILHRCSATAGCTATDTLVPRNGTKCPHCGGSLFPTDSLRIHEEVQELNPNLTALGRLRGLLEHLVMVSYLTYLLNRKPRVLGSVAFIMDGPLALFGPQAPLKRAILAYLRFVAAQLKQSNLSAPLVIGIEKTGQFAEHGTQISECIPRGTLMRLPDQYIFQRIITTRSSPSSEFGEDTYYGRKFFYKTASGQLLTITVPCLDSTRLKSRDPDDPACYTTLSASLALLDRIGTQLYEDAVIPIALAHSYASIPLSIGSKVLTLLSRELLPEQASEG